MTRPKVPWLERQSTNRDAVVLLVVGLALPLILGALNSAGIFETLSFAAWAGVATALALIVVAFMAGRRSRTDAYPKDLDRYAEHVTDALDTLQRVVRGDIPDIAVGEFVQEGIFEPAHTILSQRERGELRFSIVAPVDGELRMLAALGHSMESRRAFRLPLAGSFAGMTLADGEPRVSHDTEEDDRFAPHPRARAGREYRSIVAVPVRRGHAVHSVLVVIAAEPAAFSATEVAYIRELGAIIGLVDALATASGENADTPG